MRSLATHIALTEALARDKARRAEYARPSSLIVAAVGTAVLIAGSYFLEALVLERLVASP